jgi:cellulose synthase/poly-beta-1,6-N-acetylglucosamine synthase-like glycosyltransferase
MDGSFITIVMPVRNEGAFIEKTLRMLIEQDYPKDRYEIIVTDGISDDDTPQKVRSLMGEGVHISLVENPSRLSSAGRNLGFKLGRGDIFLVVDGHCYIPTDQLLRNIVECFQKSNADCLGRPQPLDPPGINYFQKAVALARGSRIGHSLSSRIYSDHEGYVSPVSHGAIYKRNVLEKIGLLDESFDACEDVEFNYRVEKSGLRTYMSPGLTIKYYPRSRLWDLFQQMKRYGYGRARLMRKHREAFSLQQVVPPLFFASLAVLLIFSPVSLLFRWGFITLAGIYALTLTAVSARIAWRNGWRYLWVLPQIFTTIHLGMAYGFCEGWAKLLMIRRKR